MKSEQAKQQIIKLACHLEAEDLADLLVVFFPRIPKDWRGLVLKTLNGYSKSAR